jgi:transcriptional regulator with PAS, ATPase and Fis domain
MTLNKSKDNMALLETIDLFERIFDSIDNGCAVVDKEGFFTHFNKPYGKFLNINHKQQIGKYCTDVIQNSRLHIVAKTGKAEINHIQRIDGQDMVVQRIPIRRDGKVIAVFGQVMFKNIKDVEKLTHELFLLQTKVQVYEEELSNYRSLQNSFNTIVGESKRIRQLKKKAMKSADSQLSVLISGDSGTGKELFAHAIHSSGPRSKFPFVRINCAAMPKDLIESELFGYEPGAFTGASAKGKPGRFELADRGTIFLDEIGELPLTMQPKLLRVLGEKEFTRIGGEKLINSDFRLITATNRDLEKMVSEGKFRADLYYRLNIIPIVVPPLRERQDDIPLIITSLLNQISKENQIPLIKLNTEAMDLLVSHQWPGNVRELQNVLERVVFSLEGSTITLNDLPLYIRTSKQPQKPQLFTALKDAKAQIEKEAILEALKKANHNKSQAASILKIHRTALYKKIKKYGISLKS